METLNMIFVYGTLRRSHDNHQLLENAGYFGVGATQDNYSMYVIGGYPYVVTTEARYPIVGELYSVDDATLAKLDKMEGHPHYYTRTEIAVTVAETAYTAWMYVRVPQGVLMKCGDYTNAAHSR